MNFIESSVLSIFDVIGYIIISRKLIGENKKSKLEYLLCVIILSFSMGSIGTLLHFKYNVLISAILLLIFTYTIYKKDIIETLYIYILTSIIIFIVQYFVVLAFQFLRIEIQYNFRIGLIAQTTGLALIIILSKYISIDVLYTYIRNKNKFFKYLISNIFIIILSVLFYWYLDIDGFLKNIIGFSFLTIGLVYINLISIKEGLKNKLESEKVKIYERYIPIIDELMSEIRSKQHEFDNHIQTLKMMEVMEEDHEKMISSIKTYISDLEKSNYLSGLIKLENRVLAGFLYNKIKVAERLNIKFEIIIEDYNIKFNLKDYELIEVIGNLINNAFETKVKDNEVIIKLFKYKDKNVIEVRNKHPYLENEKIDNIFKSGFSTKDSRDRGYGLYNLSTIVKKYKGEIEIFNEAQDDENYIVFKVLFIRR